MRPTLPSSRLTEGSAVAVLDDLLHQAMQSGASDLHFESDVDQFRVRFRLDGLLRTVAAPPLTIRDTLLTRLKVLARMDIAEKRLPQDGRFTYTQRAQSMDLRVSSLPTMHGEKLVLRVLNSQSSVPSFHQLGCEDDDVRRLHQALQSSDGMLLITGPTGSGKTRSLYSCLDWLNRSDINISTLEDPVEMPLRGINQVQMHERMGLGFASALRALLRQDPDVIMVGEIRDLETADIAVQAAQTGHLVLSTLHTPDATSTLERLQHMGVPTHHIAASVRWVAAQRLLRRLCEQCRTPMSAANQSHWLDQLTTLDQQLLAPWLATPTLYEAQGCSACQDGYLGRIGVFQVLPVSAAMQDLLFAQAHRTQLAAQAARESIRTLRQSGWLKVLQGQTTVSEVQRHTPSEPSR